METAPYAATFVPERTARIHDNGVTCNRVKIFRSPDQGIQVNFGANPTPFGVVLPHFHVVDQFAFFMRGSGDVEGEHLTARTIHYTDRYTPYGPIVFGSIGLDWYTIRSHFDPGASYLAVDDNESAARRGRSLVGTVPDLAETDRGTWRPIFERHDDGMAAQVVALGPGAAPPPSGRDKSQLACWVVIGGDVVQDGITLDHGSCIAVDPGDAGPAIVAGAEGATIVAFDFAAGAEAVDPEAFRKASGSELASKLREATE